MPDGRTLGGDTRTLDGNFWAGRLWSTATLGDYAEFLETSRVDFDNPNNDNSWKRVVATNSATLDPLPISSNVDHLADALQKTIVQSCTVAALELLHLVLDLSWHYSVPKH